MPSSKQSVEIPVDKGVPMPVVVKEFGRAKYPFGKMEVGDSFKVASDLIRSARNAAYLYGIRNGMRFSCRRVDEQTFRVWRIA